MRFRFVAGEARSGKTYAIQEEIIARSMEDPDRKLIYIVPEQATLQVQRQLLDKHPRHGILNVEILSFNRLAHRVFQETGGPSCDILDDVGKSMVLYKLAMDCQEQLSYYQNSIRQKGFIGQLKIMITEMIQYRIQVEDLEAVRSGLSPDSALYHKLGDIIAIWRQFVSYTEAHTAASEKILDFLAERIGESEFLNHASLYFDDFYGFTPQQYTVIAALLRKVDEVWMALTMSKREYMGLTPGMSWRDLDSGLFYETLKTYLKLEEQLRTAHIPYRIQWCSRDEANPIRHLAGQLFRIPPAPWPEPADCITLYQASTDGDEADWICRQILHLVREEGYSYGDISVVAGDLEGCRHLLTRRLEQYGIPAFIDTKADTQANPFIQMLQFLFGMVNTGFSYETVFGFFKTGLTPLSLQEIDYLENCALAQGWRGWPKYKTELSALLETEDGESNFLNAFISFVEGMRGAGQTVGERVERLWVFMEALSMETILEEQAGRFHEHGAFLKEIEYRQIYEQFQKILQTLDAVLGDRTVSATDFANLLEVGFAQCHIGLLPPTLDQLLVGDVSRSRFPEVKVLFIAGFNDNNFQKMQEENGLLTQEERAQAEHMIEMVPTMQNRVFEQQFLLYTLMAKPSDRLYISYGQSDSAGKSRRPSALWTRIGKIFPHGLGSTSEESDVTLPEPYLAKGEWMTHNAKGAAARRWYRRHGFQERLRKLRCAPLEKTPQEHLEQEEMRALLDMGNRMFSITQMERYARCPFSYYLRYGLTLKERPILQVRPLDDGNVLHEILEEAGEWFAKLWDQGATPESSADMVEDLIAKREAEYGAYQSSSRYRYYWSKLKRTAQRAVHIMQEQLKAGKFQPKFFEWTFGAGSGRSARPVEIPLDTGETLRLQGKIDRVDILQEEEKCYVRVIDYKSGNTKFAESDIYAGIGLQLPVYLEAAQEAVEQSTGKEAVPAGIFYFHLTPEYVKGQEIKTPQELADAILKTGRLEGLLLEDPALAQKMDGDIAASSKILPVRLKADGSFYKDAPVASQEEFHILEEFVRKKLKTMGESIASGNIEVSPLRQSNREQTACEYCEYKGVCRFEPKSSPDRYRPLEAVTREEFWERIKREVT